MRDSVLAKLNRAILLNRIAIVLSSLALLAWGYTLMIIIGMGQP